MSSSSPPPSSRDPWVVIGRIGGGVLFYGALGFLLDRWWGTTFMVGIGIALGAALGTYTVYLTTKHHDS